MNEALANLKRQEAVQRWGRKAVAGIEEVAIRQAIADFEKGVRRIDPDDDTVFGVAYNETWSVLSD